MIIIKAFLWVSVGQLERLRLLNKNAGDLPEEDEEELDEEDDDSASDNDEDDEFGDGAVVFEREGKELDCGETERSAEEKNLGCGNGGFRDSPRYS
jgi:hypothetical protein